jgi:hypothetical protein
MQLTNSALDRFTEIFLPIVDLDTFPIALTLEGKTIKFRILQKLPTGNEGFTIKEFYGTYRDEMLDAIVQTGENIQYFQLSCESCSFRSHDARELIEALRARDRYCGSLN